MVIYEMINEARRFFCHAGEKEKQGGRQRGREGEREREKSSSSIARTVFNYRTADACIGDFNDRMRPWRARPFATNISPRSFSSRISTGRVVEGSADGQGTRCSKIRSDCTFRLAFE